jgi:hypothetical protein
MELSLTTEVYYCTQPGKVKGLLTITEHVIVFDPFKKGDICDIIGQSGKQEGDASAFQTFIDLSDIIHFNIIELQGNRGSRNTDQVFFIEFMLSRTGTEKRGKRSDIPKVNVYFKLANVLESGESLQYLHLKTKADQISALVSSSLLQVDKTRVDSGTYVPYYEINKGYLGRLNSGLEDEEIDEEFKEAVSEIMSNTSQQQEEEIKFVPELNTASRIVTPKILSQICSFLPNVFKFRSWELLYGTYHHGRSMTSFFNHTEYSGPNVLLIKDDKRFVFGGYFSNGWKKCYESYGTGECFVFTFRNNEKMKICYSTLANTSYMASDHDSIMVGSGGNPAIYVDKNFEAGTSGKSQTYNNQVLSGEEHFQIVDLEVWGLV